MIKKVIKSKNLIKVIGLIFFVLVIIYKIDFRKVYQVIVELNPYHLAIASLITSLPLFIKVIKWHYILKKLGIKKNFKRIYKIYYISMIPGTITPAYIGGIAAQIAYLKDDHHAVSSSLTSIIIDKLSDLMAALVTSIIGLMFFLTLLKINILITAIISLLVIVSLFFSLRLEIFKKILRVIFFSIVPPRFQNQLKYHLKNILTGFEIMTPKDISIIFGLTMLSYIIIWLFLYILAQILDITQVPSLFLLLIYALTRFVIIIPITIAGIGTREITVLALLSLFSVSNETAVVYSLLMSFLFLIPIFIIGSYFWFTEPLPSFKKN